MDTQGERTALEQARRRVEQRLGLLVHWLAYLGVNTGLLVAAGTFDGSWWRLAGWGIGLAVHTAYVLVDVDGVRERLVDRELGRGPA